MPAFWIAAWHEAESAARRASVALDETRRYAGQADREVASATTFATQRALRARAAGEWARRARRAVGQAEAAAGDADRAAHRCPPARRYATGARYDADAARREAERVEAAARRLAEPMPWKEETP